MLRFASYFVWFLVLRGLHVVLFLELVFSSVAKKTPVLSFDLYLCYRFVSFSFLFVCFVLSS